MGAGAMSAGMAWPRLERAGWFWVFVAVSVAAHVLLFLRSTGRHATVAVEAPPQIMSVRLVEVRPVSPEPIVEPEPVAAPPQIIEAEPVITRRPEPEVMPKPSEPAAAPARPKPVAVKAAAVAPAVPAAPAFIEARPTSNRPPHYPDLARRNGWQGLCLVRVSVSAGGRAVAVSLARSSGHGILDQAALTAVKRWKFTPRMVRGTSAESTVEVPVNFSLR